ncbi:hypothetical protein ACG02S_12870 [Roseateles sp. DC23W]|uniref:Bacteriocin-type signal sequence-containing protein n=1 Tax=Pelomonas dachongensis TaxID=3299029 RepID=A0ABW7EMS7_9BURK
MNLFKQLVAMVTKPTSQRSETSGGASAAMRLLAPSEVAAVAGGPIIKNNDV